jgi:hypothetical protein
VLRTQHTLLAALLGLTLIVGCGGGGDGSANLDPAYITAQNAEQFAGQGVSAMDLLDSLSGMAQDFTGVFEGSAQQIPCDAGSVNVVVVDNGIQGQMNAGDSASFTYQACRFGTGPEAITLNGSMSMSVQMASGAAPGPFDYQVTVTYTNLTAVANGVTISVNGGFTLEAGSTDGVTVTAAVSGSYLSMFASGQGQAFSGTLSNFSQQGSYNFNTGAYSRWMNALVSSSELGGSVMYETTVPFTGTDPDYPDAGQLVVTGADGASVTVTAVDSTNVQVEIDLNGDEDADITIQTTCVGGR